jgi:hypothetical protein
MDESTQLAYDFVQTFNEVILFPTIGLLSAVALLIFIFGCFQYVVNANDPAARAQGVKHITWGIIGLVVMLSAYTILLIFANTFGLGDELETANEGGAVVPLPNAGTDPQTPVYDPGTDPQTPVYDPGTDPQTP